MATLRRQNLSELVAAGIKRLIIDGRLKPGDRLPTEQEMADRFGVSRVSVREATKALSFLGIIRAAPRRGLSVGEVDMSRVTEYLGFHLALTDYPTKQLLQTRFVIETGALPYVAEAMAENASLFGKLEAMVEDARHNTDAECCVEADIAFHRALLEASAIRPLLAIDDLLQIFFNRFERAVLFARWHIVVNEHLTLIRLLRDGNVEDARRMLAVHLAIYSEQLDE